MKQNDDGKTVAAVDLLVPGIGELIGGSQREEDIGKLKQRMKELNLDEKIIGGILIFADLDLFHIRDLESDLKE